MKRHRIQANQGALRNETLQSTTATRPWKRACTQLKRLFKKKKSNKLPQYVNISHGPLNFLPPSHFKMSYLHPHAHGFRSESLRPALIDTCTIQLQPAHETPVFMEKKTKNHIRQQIPLNSCMI